MISESQTEFDMNSISLRAVLMNEIIWIHPDDRSSERLSEWRFCSNHTLLEDYVHVEHFPTTRNAIDSNDSIFSEIF